MPLSPGIRLGPYQVVAPIGAGGMGEVYRAKDTKLDREVAIKILPEALGQDAERLARFEREAKVLASLNHPNIASIYGVEEGALVMELVEGPTLADHIAAGPMPVDEALPVARQIAEALEYAHEHGVIHRDLKPANIKITADGRVKVLDFGLAKALSSDTTSGDPAASPTLTMRATLPGVILGTAAYMSPEQAKGKPVDRRSDIWAFGVVLLEMLTGRRMYAGETVSETLAAVIMKEPDLSSLPAATPAGVRMLLRRCLDRDAKRRLRDIGEARIAIEDALSGTVGAEPAAPAPVRARRPMAAWILAAAATVAALALAFIHFRETAPLVRPVRFTIHLPPKALMHTFALSPDGRYLVVAAAAQGKSGLWVRPLDSLDYQFLPSTENAVYPFWSPDSRAIAFFAGGKLKKVAVTGGPVQTICEASNGRGGAWYPDGTIVFAPSAAGGMFRVSASGGTVKPAVTYDGSRGMGFQRFPISLPDRHFLFAISSSQGERNGVYVGSLDSQEARRLLAEASSVAYAPPAAGQRTGHLLFVRQGTLMAQAFDAGRLEIKGEAFPVAEQVAIAANVIYGAFSVSQTGVLAYRIGGGDKRQPVWFDRDGKRLGAVGEPAQYGWFALSPDQQRLVRTIADSQGQVQDLWMHDLARGSISRFTFGPGINTNPVWSPDGSRIIFAANRRGPIDIYQKISSGGGKDQLLLKGDVPTRPTDWSRDGRFIVFQRYPKSSWDLWLLPLEGDRKPVPFLETEFSEQDGQFSPDSKWMAYASNENGVFQVYVQPLPPTGAKYQVSTGGGSHPRWRRDGKELYYIAANEKLMAVAVRAAGATFEAGIPQALFDTRIAGATSQFGGIYDASVDGRRFLINVPTEEAIEVPITVVLNWQQAIGKQQ